MFGWAVGRLTVRVRYSRGADFSGTCIYSDRRIYINLGRHLTYPYRMATHIARAKSLGRTWYKPTFCVDLSDGYQIALFIFMHELYHLLVKVARRNTRQKESMCDRFATRHMVDRFGATVCTEAGRPVARELWDFQDLDRFVAAARDRRVARRPISIRGKNGIPICREPAIVGNAGSVAVRRSKAEPSPQPATQSGAQLLLFPN